MNRKSINILIHDYLAKIGEADELDYRINSRQETIDEEMKNWGSTEIYPADNLEVFFDMVDAAKNIAACEHESPAGRRAALEALKAYNRILVVIGFLAPVTRERAKEACRDGIGVRMSHFPEVDGQLYESVQSYSQFLEANKC